MNWLWTGGGINFGYRERDNLWTYDGRHVGRSAGNDVYAPDGAYLGELAGTHRLITCQAKPGSRQAGFTRSGRRVVYASYADYSGYALDEGYEDFPAPGNAAMTRATKPRGERRPEGGILPMQTYLETAPRWLQRNNSLSGAVENSTAQERRRSFQSRAFRHLQRGKTADGSGGQTPPRGVRSASVIAYWQHRFLFERLAAAKKNGPP
ncbi:hypothetical protein LMG28727_07187 [Paraburkholderia kirstenboschensis]|uniref:hypothetical protein n=1 Tax=Paraburkholderia kirstenboschensis TaxID=1245436 RepID=UPI0019194864|nr:hypothetical protein [Paraburkholderia kirstenboschensis]CAD6560579.1 hypothetical protein LMG28727_07187 [Paraburkholderia kirstenboschensis]